MLTKDTGKPPHQRRSRHIQDLERGKVLQRAQCWHRPILTLGPGIKVLPHVQTDGLERGPMLPQRLTQKGKIDFDPAQYRARPVAGEVFESRAGEDHILKD